MPNPFSVIAQLVLAGAKRLIAGLARQQVEVEQMGKKPGKQKPITEAIAKMRKKFDEVMRPKPTYEDYRNVWRQQLRAAKAAKKESDRQEDQIDNGIAPTPPREPAGPVQTRQYVLRVELINPRTGVSYWSTVFVEAPAGLTLPELKAMAFNAVWTNNRDSKGFQNARVSGKWETASVVWIG